jgi:flagellar hook-associated protein 2
VGTGTLTFTIGLAQYSFDITTANQTLQGISNTINAASGSTGISASLITSDAGTSIVFSSLTGTNNAFTVSVTNDGDANNTDASGLSRLASNNLTTLQSARDALVKIEGVSVTSDYNVIKNAINGVEIELVATNENSPITLSINVDVDRAKLAIKEFVDSYNSVFESVKKLTQYEQHPNAKSTTGILIGDSTLRGIEFQMRRIITEIVTSQPAGFTTLSQIGITSDQYTGNLIIDDQQLTEALNTNFDAVGQLFMDPTTGVVNSMESFLENYVEINGILQTRTDGLNKSIEVITEQRINLERHLKSLEKRLITQFIAMDTIVARLRSLSEYLETQLENLPQPMMFRK